MKRSLDQYNSANRAGAYNPLGSRKGRISSFNYYREQSSAPTLMKFKVVLCGLLVQLIAGLTHVEFGPQKRIELEFEDLLGEELAPLLSKDAVIVLPSSPRWDQLTARSSSPRIEPAYKVIVEVATEEDIQQTASAR